MRHLVALLAVALCSQGVDAATWYVAVNGSDAAAGTNWVTAKQTIQAAIDIAVASDTVLVSNGVYDTGGRAATGFSLTNRVVIDKPILVQSVNGAAVTTILGARDPVTLSNGNAAVRCVWMTNGGTLVGFTLTNGATRTAGLNADSYGGGLWAQSYLASVSNCVLAGNVADSDGGGSYGGTLHRCRYAGNHARYGGGASFFQSTGALNNCLLVGNFAGNSAGGVYGGVLNNCTLIDNSAVVQGGGAMDNARNNCIAYFNTAPAGGNYIGGTQDYTCTTPMPTNGVGNITNDPMFVATNDLRLAAGSPCINAGSNGLAAGASDLAGNPRIVGGRVDMGALEAPIRASVSSTDGPITIVDTNFAIPNPSVIRVGGVTGTVVGLRVTLHGLQHTYPDDLDIVLVSPAFLEGVKLMSDAGGDPDLSNAVLTIDDTAGAVLPDAALITNGVYRPTDYEIDTLGGVTFVTNLSSLIMSGINGDWRLFISDDSPDDTGSLTAWSLEFASYDDPTSHFVDIANATPAWPYSTWATAATNIQDAIGAATDGDTVLVSNGVYQTGGRVAAGSALTNRVLIDKPITVQSVNGPAVTTIRGAKDPATLSNGNAAVRCVWMTNDAMLAGFTLASGATLVPLIPTEDVNGGGVWAQSTAAMVSNCTISGNTAHTRGGGARRGTLNHCTLAGNSADSGGGAQFSTLNNCLLTGNAAFSFGGGAHRGTLNNCTLAGNVAMMQGGGVDDSALNNCIVYLNTAPIDANHNASEFNNSCTMPLPATGTGNITNDPMFVSLGTTNLALASNSPCINLGNNAFAPGSTDLAGNPRIWNSAVDMGAYEFQGAANPDFDGDGWDNAEEYIADTDPIDGASLFPRATVTNGSAGRTTLLIGQTSTGRVYGIHMSTNLTQSPQGWTLVPPEQAGTASALALTITNVHPAASYRSGVRLP